MKKKDRELVYKDICARFAYDVKCFDVDDDGMILSAAYEPGACDKYDAVEEDFENYEIPLLRPMSTITEEEKKEIGNYLAAENFTKNLEEVLAINGHLTDYLNSKMLDWRGLIPKGLAISTEEDIRKRIKTREKEN